MIRRLKLISIVLCAVGAVLIAAGTTLHLTRSPDVYTGNVKHESLEFDAPRELVVITGSLPIAVRYDDTDKVRVSYTSGLALIFTEEKGTLRITQDDSFTLSLFSLEAYKAGVEISLPHKVYDRISLSSSGGSVQTYSLSAGSMEISTKGGDIRLYNIDERTSIRTESGSVEATVSSLSGDMRINAGESDVKLTFPRDAKFNLEFYTEKGSFTSEHFDEKYYKKFGDAAILDSGVRTKLTVSTTKGDLCIYDSEG